MTTKTLIINGISNIDELSKLGIGLAEEYQKSDRVILVNNNIAKQVKYLSGEDNTLVWVIDVSMMPAHD